MEMQLPTVTVDDLRIFHAKHFSHAPAPAHFVHGAEPTEEAYEEVYEEYEEEDGLGYYPDGVKRTLTDEQIALFRHTEIQTIIRKRIRKRENGGSPEPGPKPQSSGSTPSAGGDKVQDGSRVEKGTNWTKISAKSRAKNSKRRKRYQASLKEKRRKQRDGDEESDEWDPWHQANGPDVQKDTPVDLDY